MTTLKKDYEPLKDLPVVCAENAQKEKELLKTEHLRIAVGTWNVAGRIPPKNLDLSDWLETNGPVDIYVIGFQEIVPLNVGNVCGVDDVQPAMIWQGLIRETINRLDYDFDQSLMDKDMDLIQPPVDLENYSDQFLEDEAPQRPLLPSAGNVSCRFSDPCKKQTCYVRAVSKQMVGVHISVWVRKNMCRFIHNLSVSCVGVGLMGCLGNKGSVTVSMRLHETSFCFICAHLTSGGKQEDEKRRNWDAMEVLNRTHFPSSKNGTRDSSRSIWGHDRIIWLGDLNYRLNLLDDEIRLLVAKEDWTGLIKKDQLRKQSKKGRIFEGWQEGTITFPPTYKYEFESNEYAGENLKHGEKQRSPAWCDRVIWHGKGLKLLEYKRGDKILILTDHICKKEAKFAYVKRLFLDRRAGDNERVWNQGICTDHIRR
ncbi:hypothetical protein GOP47_0008285 [Adiantum capillus-veneris]|uniref:Inositol polyphosphate-related phosphatase domain-containing protein n=1 Tax=Adiantum capillus-veneris TaxID=13818 RepID=A0A9D4UYM6_ADICA|nr:hypothetical protein GOP47_0008285 [Adiantum capillus-veneris]